MFFSPVPTDPKVRGRHQENTPLFLQVTTWAHHRLIQAGTHFMDVLYMQHLAETRHNDGTYGKKGPARCPRPQRNIEYIVGTQ